MDATSFRPRVRTWREATTGPMPGRRLDPAMLVRLKNITATIGADGLHGQVIGTDGPFGNLVTECASGDVCETWL